MDQTVDLYGTDDDDVITFTTGEQHVVTINGEEHVFDPGEVSVINIHALGGDDSITITGTAEKEVAETHFGSVDVVGPRYEVHADEVERIRVRGGGGTEDEATLFGSIGIRDAFVGNPRFSRLYGRGYDHRVDGFRQVVGVATPLSIADNSDSSQFAPIPGDVAKLYGSPGSDTFEATPRVGELIYNNARDHFVRASGFRWVTAYADSPEPSTADAIRPDVARLVGSAFARDVFVGGPGDSTLNGYRTPVEWPATTTPAGDVFPIYSNYTRRAVGFEQVTCTAPDFEILSAQDVPNLVAVPDIARLFDSPEPDALEAGPRKAKLEFGAAEGRFIQVEGFRNIYAMARTEDGGVDQAHLLDSPRTADVFVATPTDARLYGPGFFNHASGFEQVTATVAADTEPDDPSSVTHPRMDVARLFDSPGADVFNAGPERAEMQYDGSSEHFARAEGFSHVLAYGRNDDSRTDKAYLADSEDTRDIFVATPAYARFFGPGFSNRVLGFEQVTAKATNSGENLDLAKLYDSADSDTFEGTPEYGKLTFGNRDDHFAMAAGFRRVVAYARATDAAGSIDVALLRDSAGDDTLIATPLYSKLFNRDEYYNLALYFDEVTAVATRNGARDRAYLFDSPGDDHLDAVGNLAELTTPTAVIRAYDFGWVTAISSKGGRDTKHVETIDYVLTTIGPWIDV